MNYIGIDPSTSSTGYAVVDENERLITYGRIEGLADNPMSFANLYQQLDNIINAFSPKHITCETQFIGPNRETSIKLIRPTGVILALAGKHNADFNFVAPAKWRKHYHGEGKWGKKDTYDFTLSNYPQLAEEFKTYAVLKNGKISEARMYNSCNDMTDAIGIACAGVRMDRESTDG